MSFRAPHETAEFMPVPVTRKSVVITTGVEYSVVAPGARPGTWIPAVTLDGQTGINITGLTAGRRDVWARIGTVVVGPAYFELT